MAGVLFSRFAQVRSDRFLNLDNRLLKFACMDILRFWLELIGSASSEYQLSIRFLRI